MKQWLEGNRQSINICRMNIDSMHNVLNKQMNNFNIYVLHICLYIYELWKDLCSCIVVSNVQIQVDKFQILIVDLFLPMRPWGAIIFLIHCLSRPKSTNPATSVYIIRLFFIMKQRWWLAQRYLKRLKVCSLSLPTCSISLILYLASRVLPRYSPEVSPWCQIGMDLWFLI